MSVSIDFDIVVCGGGMVGATLAGLLLRDPALQGLRIALIEPRLPTQAPGTEVDIRVSAISRASERILTRAGAWSFIDTTQRCAYQDMHVWDAQHAPHGESALHFSASALGEPNLGYIIANNVVQWAALSALQHERLTRFNAGLKSIDLQSDAAHLSLTDSRRLTARLVIGADGAQSASRECVGIATRQRPYPQSALVTHVRTERPHRFTAWQRFLPAGPLAFLPLNDGRCSIVWSTTPEHAEQLLALDETALGAALTDASEAALGRVTVAAPRAAFPLRWAQVDEYCRHRFVLVGDAAHSMHPLAGQGVNLGFMDAASLVQVLSEARATGASIEALSELPVLRRYERWRKTENTLALGGVDGINRLFSNHRVLLGGLRGAGLHAVQHLPLLKRWLMQRALGLSGDRPAAARAER